jgi:hypothetical protein
MSVDVKSTFSISFYIWPKLSPDVKAKLSTDVKTSLFTSAQTNH